MSCSIEAISIYACRAGGTPVGAYLSTQPTTLLISDPSGAILAAWLYKPVYAKHFCGILQTPLCQMMQNAYTPWPGERDL